MIEHGKTLDEIQTALGKSPRPRNESIRNLASRRYGYSWNFPFGDLIVDKAADFKNLNRTLDGKADTWNDGMESENLGTLRGVTFWVRVRAETNRNTLVSGMANMKQVFWFRDSADRVVLHRYTIPTHNEWQKITIPCGPQSGLELHDSRIDELVRLLGITFSLNFYVKERELTGAQFDWTRVVGMGTVSEDSYDDNLMYVAGQNGWLDALKDWLIQGGSNVASFYLSPVIDYADYIVDHVNFELADVSFDKDVYVVTSDAVDGELRQELVRYSEDSDYVNMRKVIGKRMVSRKQFHPHKKTIYCDGDVRLRAGHAFRVKAAHDSSVEAVALSVEHIEDQHGYHCVIEAVERYEVDT